MIDRYQRAELLTALWRLGAPEEPLPTSHGILDRALFRLRDRLPAAIGQELSFSTTTVGLRCLELPAILLAAQEALLTTEPNPTYLSTQVTLDEDSARQIVVDADLSSSQARLIGAELLEAVKAVKTEMGSALHPVAA